MADNKYRACRVMATLSGLSHRWLGARPGGPGTQPLLALCLLLLLEAAMAAVPTWAVMPPAAGRTCATIEVNAYPIPEEQPGVAADVGRHYVDRDNGINTYCCNTYCCDAGLMENVPVNGLGDNGNGSPKNPTGDCTGDVASIRRVARQHPDWVGSCVFDATNNDWKQSPFKEAPGNAAGIRWGIAVHSYVTWAPNYYWIGTCNSSGSINSAFTASKQNPYKEAYGGAAGIKKVSRPMIITVNSPLFHFPLNAYLPPVSAMGANTAKSSSSTLSRANPGQRSHLCSPLTREATLSNRKWRLLETS